MQAEKIRREINKLPLKERLELVETLWDDIAATNACIPLPVWQRQELDSRYQAYQQGDNSVYDWQSVHEELRNKYK